MKLKSIIVPGLILVTVLILSMTVSACDRLIQISGMVYEWVDPPAGAKSLIYHKEYTADGLLNENCPSEMALQPLSEAFVHCFGEIPNDSFYSNEISNDRGEFRILISLGQRMGDYTATIEVIKDGYQSVKRDVIDCGSTHLLNVVLVRKSE